MKTILKWYWLPGLPMINMSRERGKIVAAACAALVHIAVFIFLFFFYIRQPEIEEEGGVPVILGNSEQSQGFFDPATMTEVELAPENVPAPEQATPQTDGQELITQAEEPTVAIPPKKKETIKPKKEKPKKEVVKPKEKTEAEKQAEAERAAAQKAGSRVAGAFGKGSKMGSSGSGNTGTGTEGSLSGNSSEGKLTGTGGYGTFDLGGRSIGEGGLPRPVYNVQDEGRVVVTITVNPAGTVIATSINKRTNTVNAALRKAAEDAAKRARFNGVEGLDNQTGTITYYFKLK